MTPADAKDLFGRRFIGPAELVALAPRMPLAPAANERLPWSEDVIKANAGTHLLIACPAAFYDGGAITINSLRARFGIDPAISEPCFYNQDWYVKDAFADMPLDPGWHLIRAAVREDARARRPEEIEAGLSRIENFPNAVVCVFIFFANWFHTGGEILWKHDFLWCRDRDHQGDRIYVGRYKDPTGVNKNGFGVHRHLALRSNYSAAPEIIG